MKIIVVMVWMGFCLAGYSAETLSQDQWRQIFKTNDLEEIVKEIQVSSWPKIESKTKIESLTDLQVKNEKMDWLALLTPLVEKIKQYDAESKDDGLSAKAPLYSELRNSLLKSGGYSNYVVANMLDLLISAHTCKYFVDHPTDYDVIQKGLQTLALPKTIRPELINIFREENPECDLPSTLDSAEDKEKFNQMLQCFQIIPNKIIFKYHPVYDLGTSVLLENLGLVQLLWREAQVVVLMQTHLPGGIEYFKRGGSWSELKESEKHYSLWEKRMGDIHKLYKSPMLTIQKIGPDHLLGLYEIFSEGYVQSPQYMMATN